MASAGSRSEQRWPAYAFGGTMGASSQAQRSGGVMDSPM
eukprot:gene47041-21641_t